MSELVLIANPMSRSGKTAVQLPSIERLVRRHLGSCRTLLTEGAGDGQRLGRLACQQGAKRVIVAGGDGTVSEVVTGMFEAGCADVALGILPLGSGSDLARVLGIRAVAPARFLGHDHAALEQLIVQIAGARRRRIDAGCVTCQGPDGRPLVRWFLNITSFGMTGHTMLWIDEQARRGRRGAHSYVAGGLRSLFTYREPVVTLKVDGRVVHAGRMLFGVAANGQYFGSGMRIAPAAVLDDGFFDVVWADALSRLRALALFPLLFLGQHMRDAHVHWVRGRELELSSEVEVWLEADGEALGRLPARIELKPQALTLLGVS